MTRPLKEIDRVLLGAESGLPDRTRRVFEAIVHYKRVHDGNSPSTRDIMAATGITSTSVMRYQIGVLIREGLLREVTDLEIRARGIEVVGGRWTYEPLGDSQQNAERPQR